MAGHQEDQRVVTNRERCLAFLREAFGMCASDVNTTRMSMSAHTQTHTHPHTRVDPIRKDNMRERAGAFQQGRRNRQSAERRTHPISKDVAHHVIALVYVGMMSAF